MKRTCFFTLLETVAALFILSLVAGILLWQLATANKRMLADQQDWAITHELAQAAEFYFLYGPDAEPDAHFFSGEYRILKERCIQEYRATTPWQIQKILLKIQDESGEVLDCWNLDILTYETK